MNTIFSVECLLQVVKLCDLENDDNVTSVGWAQRGTHLAVGTSNGKVQVCYAYFVHLVVCFYMKENC